MKVLNFIPSIHIHPLFFLLAISAFLTGAIYEFVILFSIVMIHELGHFFTAKHFGWRVTKIEFWLFGGAVVSEEHNTRPFREQVTVILAGPLQHIWIFAVLTILQVTMGPHPLLSVAGFYNGVILLFNLLPIWPLDGGKIIFYMMNQAASFRRSLMLTLFFSFLAMLLIGSWLTLDERWTFAGILLAAFLIVENVLEWRRRTYTQMRYLMHCALEDRRHLRPIYINVPEEMLVRDALKNIRSNRNHLYVLKEFPLFYIVDEQECLQAYFEKKDSDLRLRDLPKIAL